jgi:hypothetical protein
MNANFKLVAPALALLGTLLVRGVFAADVLTAERYPDADLVVVDDTIDIAYRADGTYVQVEEEMAKALTEKGRRDLSTLSIGYSLRYGKGEILSVEIVGADGVARAVDFAKTLKEATDNSSMSANIYDPLDKTLSCAVPGIKIGETRRVRTRQTVTRARVKDQFADLEVLESSVPIVKAKVTITGPKERPLQSVAVRHPLGNVKASVENLPDGRIRHTWTVADSPQAFPEPNMPPLYTQAQNVRVSTAKDWKEISRWYWDLSLPHLLKTNAAMTNKVEEIKAKTKGSREELAGAIFKFVSQEIRYMGLTMEDTSPGYAPHDVDITFDNRYGVCRDKAALLVAMLRIAGFEAYPVLISAGSAKMDEEIPLPYFNHAIVAVASTSFSNLNTPTTQTPKHYILMDPTDEAAAELMPPYLCDCSYLVAHPEGEPLRTSPVVDPAKNAVNVTGKGRLAKDGSILVDYSIGFLGINDTFFRHRLLGMKPEERREHFEGILKGVVAGAELLKFDLQPADLRDTDAELEVALLVKFPETLVKGETQDALKAPSLSSAFGIANILLAGRTSLETRKYALKLVSTAATTETLTLDLGDAVGAAASLPRTETIDGKYAFTRTYAVTNGALTMARRLTLGAVEFSPDEYRELRESIKRVEARERESCLFKKNRFANADVHCLRRERNVYLTTACDWVATNVVEKEVLTYDGKRNAAELEFAYNPTWQSVEIVSAVVSNKDGKVARLTDKEINVMDCDWAAAAPRYPASKQLVANLPAVEIGSVVSYTIAIVVSNSPLPYYETFYNDVYEPTDLLVNRCFGEGEPWEIRVENPKVLPSEPMQPDGRLWRDHKTFSRGDFREYARQLRPATEVRSIDPSSLNLPTLSIRAIRDWMAKHVRIVGPGFAEIRLADHLTDPETILKERYATRVGYIRTLCALLKGAGYAADIVFAADDAEDSEDELKLEVDTQNVRAFSHALCRVRVTEGGFLGFGGTAHTYYLGTENEYTPLEASAYVGARFLDPRSFEGIFGTVEVQAPEYEPHQVSRYEIGVRENGAVDIDSTAETFGSSVGPFRKRYAEMLPEMRNRHYQAILGNLAQAASATGDLITDTESYPAKMRFSAYVPNYATIQGDSMTISLSMLVENLFPLAGSVRETPIGLPASDAEEMKVVVDFPEAYTKIEHLPSAFCLGEGRLFRVAQISAEAPGVIRIELVRESVKQRGKMLSREYFALLKDWDRISASTANSTITVRK